MAENTNDNGSTKRETVILGFDDRRRLAVEEILQALRERGKATQIEVGQAVLNNVINESEVRDMADMVTISVQTRIAQGSI